MSGGDQYATIADVIRIVERAEVLSNTDGEEPRITALSLRVPREQPDASPEAAEDDEAMRIARTCCADIHQERCVAAIRALVRREREAALLAAQHEARGGCGAPTDWTSVAGWLGRLAAKEKR